MIFERGNMFKLLDDPDYRGLFCVTTNGYINKRNELVMGRGAAIQLKNLFPDIPIIFANKARNEYRDGKMSYNLLYYFQDPFYLGAFQVKYHWKEKASLHLIEKASKELNKFSIHFSRVDLNFPGIGNGGLDKMEVLPILGSELTNNNIHIWEL